MWKYLFTRVVIKIKIFHSCRNRVVHVALVLFVSHSSHTCVALVSLLPGTLVVKYIRSAFCVKKSICSISSCDLFMKMKLEECFGYLKINATLLLFSTSIEEDKRQI